MIHVVLYEPELAQNVGNIIRTCAALNAQLHIIHPINFLLHSKAFKRAMLDYDVLMQLIEHDSLDACLESIQGDVFYITRYGSKTPDQFAFNACTKDIVIVFGKETSGLPKALMRANIEKCIRIPMHPHSRSLNVANAVAIMLFEVQRQLHFEGLSCVEVLKGEDWLLQ